MIPTGVGTAISIFGLRPNKRLKLAARVGIMNDDFFFSAPQLKRDPLGRYEHRGRGG